MKSSKPITNFGLVLLIVFMGFACKRENRIPAVCSADNTVRFPQDALDRFCFHDSTYWIYIDSLTNLRDSIYVNNFRGLVQNRYEDVHLYNKCYEGFAFDLHSYIYGRTRVWLTPLSHKDYTIDYSEEYFEIKYMPEEINYHSLNRFYLKGNQYNNYHPDDSLISKLDTFSVASVRCSDVLKFTDIHNSDIYKEAWFVKNIGLIKFRRQDGSVWELVRYKIKQ